jgi:hypothetical protein
MWTPRSGDYDYDLGREVELIATALAVRGPLTRSELAAEIGARSWGPGVYRRAIRVAIGSGKARRDPGNRSRLTSGDGRIRTSEGVLSP